jgi:transposase
MNGLVNIVQNEMDQNPLEGGIYLFRNRHRDKLKCLLWDRNGFFLGYKRLEKGHFDLPVAQEGSVEITLEQLRMLLSGMPMIYIQKSDHSSIRLS